MLKYETKSVNGADSMTYEIAEADVPTSVLWKLANRTFSHIMSNEASSACGNARESAEKDGTTFQEVAFLDEWRKKKIDAIKSGTLSMRQGGPRRDPVEKKFEDLIMAYIRESLKKHGLSVPKADAPPIDLGGGQTRTRAELIANAKASQGERLMTEAKRAVAAEARATKAKDNGPTANVAEAVASAGL